MSLILNVNCDIFSLQVKHSQRMNDTPLSPWILVEKSGNVLVAHCNCIAELGESCSHIGAVLFYIAYATGIRDSKTCTEEKAYWLLPGYHAVEYKEVCDIDFSTAKALKKNLDTKVVNCTNIENAPATKKSCFEKYATPTSNELNSFFNNFKKCGKKAAILSIVPGYCNEYTPQLLTKSYPKSLLDLYDSKLACLNYKELIDYCQKVNIAVTTEQRSNVEVATRKQHLSKNWFHFRTGRITASKIYRVCHTTVTHPSVSLIKEICYLERFKFKSQATKWGCDHESVALKNYCNLMEELHENFSANECGFLFHRTVRYIGASPDVLVSCNCCGNGYLEIKCPFEFRENFVFEILGCDDSYLEGDVKNGIKLKTTHMYYYQIQCQLNVTSRKYCDFYVRTEKDHHYERVFPDTEFWIKNKNTCESFFRICLLPELTGKFYSSTKTVLASMDKAVVNNNDKSNSQKLYCYCQSEDFGEMITCDSITCSIDWFHVKCLHLLEIPIGKWYCPDRQKSRYK